MYISSTAYRQFRAYELMNTQSTQNRGSVSAVTKVGAVQGWDSLKNTFQGSVSSDSVSYVRDYQKQASGLRDAANALRGDAASEAVVSSSNTQVADASANWKLNGDVNYELNVTQLAAGQVNQSAGMDQAGTGFSGDLNLITGSGSFTFAADPGAANNLDAMNKLMKQINDANTGVKASVSVKEGKASLQLASAKTGERSAFVAGGSLADATGLSTATQKAQNAEYTVKNLNASGMLEPTKRTSESNTIDVDGAYRVQAQLKGTGTSTIKAATDNSKTADGIQKMVDSFNSNLKLLNDNADRGTGGLTQMKRMLLATGNDKAMDRLGISSNKDGTLDFDRSKYLKSASDNASLTKDVLSGGFGLATRIYNAADRGLGQSSSSLLSQDIKAAKMQQAYHPIGMVSSYGRNGALAMTNYQNAGALLNLLI